MARPFEATTEMRMKALEDLVSAGDYVMVVAGSVLAFEHHVLVRGEQCVLPALHLLDDFGLETQRLLLFDTAKGQSLSECFVMLLYVCSCIGGCKRLGATLLL